MALTTLDYAPRIEFDTGRFVAMYLQILAWLSIAAMIAGLFFGSVHIDLSPIFMFWAASALKRRSRKARKWVIGVSGLTLVILALFFLLALIRGTNGMILTLDVTRVQKPKLWQIGTMDVAIAVVVSVPFVVLMSAKARRQFAGDVVGE